MSDLPAPVNKEVDQIDALIDAVSTGAAVRVYIAAATAAQPWLGYPIVSTVFKWIVSYALGSFDKYAKIIADDSIIDSQTNAEARDVQKAKAALKAALASGDSNAIQKASDAYDLALGHLVHSDGS